MPSSFCFYLYTENLSLPVFVPILAYKKDTCQNMPVSLLHFFRITHPYSITVIDISSVFTSFPYMIWCWGQKVFCPQLMPTNCSAAKQLTQGLRSASVGAKRVPLAHSTYKHSKFADLLRKSLLSTLRFGRCKTNIHWMFCTSCLAGPKFKSFIVQARTAFWTFAPGIFIIPKVNPFQNPYLKYTLLSDILFPEKRWLCMGGNRWKRRKFYIKAGKGSSLRKNPASSPRPGRWNPRRRLWPSSRRWIV